jgi:hypothetical protein
MPWEQAGEVWELEQRAEQDRRIQAEEHRKREARRSEQEARLAQQAKQAEENARIRAEQEANWAAKLAKGLTPEEQAAIAAREAEIERRQREERLKRYGHPIAYTPKSISPEQQRFRDQYGKTEGDYLWKQQRKRKQKDLEQREAANWAAKLAAGQV